MPGCTRARDAARRRARSHRHRPGAAGVVAHRDARVRARRDAGAHEHGRREPTRRPLRATGRRSPRASPNGDASSASRRSASPTPSSAPRKRACMSWLDAGRHGEMDYMARHGAARARPARARPRHDPRDHRAHELLAGRCARRARRCSPIPRAATSRATRSAATITRCCARALATLAAAHRRRGRSVRPPRVHRQRAGARGRARRARRASAGAASTRCCSRATTGSLFFLGEIYTDLPLPVTRAGERPLRHLHRVHRRVPDRRDRRALRARRAALHLLPHDRAQGRDPRGRCAR